MIDTHTHLNFGAFKEDWKEVVERAVTAGVNKMLVVGTDLATSKRAVEMAKEHEALYASVGVHPHHAQQLLDTQEQMESILTHLKELARSEKMIAIGEIGIDYHEYKHSRYEAVPEEKADTLLAIQKELFKQQLVLAQELHKPVIIHSREAGDEVLQIISELRTPITGVFHCFEGSKKYLKRVVEAGFYVSFTGNITFIPDRAEVSTLAPIEKLLLETDCPYMTPTPYRGERNEPKNVLEVAKMHAKVRNMDLDEVFKHTTQNAHTLFRV